MEHGQDDSSNNLDSKSAEVVSSHPCTALDDDSNQDRSKGDSSEVMDSQPTQAASDDTTTSATTSTAAQEYNKADARKSIASSTSSSSSSSADMFTEAMDAGEAPPDSSLNSSVARRGEDAATHSHASSSSLEDKLSAATLLDTHSDSNSTAPTSKNTSLAASDAVPPPPLKAAVDLHEADLAASEEVSSLPPNRPFSLQAPETPSSAVSDHYHIHKRNQPSNGDSLLKQQLDAYAQASTNGPFATTTAASNGDDGDDRDGGRWRDSVAEGTTTSAMDSVALSDADSRPSSVLLSPLMVDKANSSLANNIGSFQEVEVEGDLPTSNSDANSANAEAGPSSSSKANANGRHSHRYHDHTASNGSINSNSSKLKRSSASTPNVDGPSRQSTASSAYDYGLIQQRAESHHAELEEHPKRHRRTLRGSEDLRANFEKLREEMNTPAPANLPEDNAAKTTAGESTTIGIGTSAAQEAQVIDWDFWGEVMSDYEGVAKTRPKDLSRAIQNGIPAALRGMMWQLMSASKDPELEATYSQLMRLPSAHEKAIIRDLNRTFPTHEYFHDKAGVGQGNLLNIMKAYSLYDDEVGYCQGMAFVVGPLLLNMPDEEAFCVLVRLMKSYDLRSQYIPDMPGLQLRLYQFDRLLEELLPAVFMHLLRQGIKSSMYASQWFLTLLAYRFPLELVCSVFDLIFAEGVEAIFRFALAVMKRNEHKIVEMEFEQVLDFLKMGLFEDYKHQIEEGAERDEDAPIYSAQTFVKEALQVKITPMMLDQYASEWTDMCRQQNAQSEEVEQLRAINKKLSNQVRHLEASLSQINQEHCELVKQVVATRLEKEELEDELVRVKMALAQESLLREEGRGSIASRGSYASFGSSAGPRSPEVDRRDSQLSIPK